MNARERLLRTFALSNDTAPPRLENEFSGEAIEAWRSQGVLDERRPEEVFGLDRIETAEVDWRRADGKAVVESPADLVSFRDSYDANSPERVPPDWPRRRALWRNREHVLVAAPWNEGLFQVMGVADAASFSRAMAVMCEQPHLIEAVMEHYADFLDDLIPRAFDGIEIEFALFYEAIASPHATVISPRDYARFAIPALRRVIRRLHRQGVRYCILRTSGEVRPLIPLWLEAGINGLIVTQTGQTGLCYTDLRRTYGHDLRLFGGIDWRAVVAGPEAVDRVLRKTAQPLLEKGGYIPYLDDTIRAYCPFEGFRYYRQRLDSLLARVYGSS